MKAQVSNLGAYDGNANGDLTIEIEGAERADEVGGRAHRIG